MISAGVILLIGLPMVQLVKHRPIEIGEAIDGGAATHLNAVLKNHLAGLRHFSPALRRRHKADTKTLTTTSRKKDGKKGSAVTRRMASWIMKYPSQGANVTESEVRTDCLCSVLCKLSHSTE